MVQYLFSEKDACAYLGGIGRGALQHFRDSNQLPYVLVMGIIKYKREDLENLANQFESIKNGKKKPSKLILP